MKHTQRGIRLIAGMAGLAFATTACGFNSSSDNDSTDNAGDETPATEDASEGTEGGGGGASGDITMLVPAYSDQTKGLWEAMIAEFRKENGDVNVELQVESWDNINQVIQTKTQSGDAPDILNIDAYASYALDDLLYPVEEVVSPEVLEDFQPSFAENASLDGTMYGMPLIASARSLFYNKDLFEQAGIAEPPKTWDELYEAAKKISELGDGVVGYGMPLGSEEAQAETSIFVFGNGGSWGDAEEITADAPENVEAVEFMQKMIDDGLTEPDPGSQDRTPLLNVFKQGKIGMMVGLPPTVTEIETEFPELNYGTAAIPTADGEPVTVGVADHLMAFKNDGENQAAVQAFLDYFFSAEVYTKFVDAEGFLPTTQSGSEALADKESIQTFLELLPSAQFYPSTNPAWPSTQGALQQQIGTIAQGADPAEVLAEIQAAAEGGF